MASKISSLRLLCVAFIAVVTVNAQIGPVEEDFKLPTLHNKTFPFYDTIGPQCNFWKNLTAAELTNGTAPWPLNCRVYKHKNDCNRYEISRDGKSVDSCKLKKDCPFTPTTPECLEYFPAVNRSELRFPETGKQCFFREALYPLNPWPENCKIFQSRDVCNTYEIADTGEYIVSCDIAMIRGDCIAPNREEMVCLEYCPDEGCVQEELARYVAMAASTMLLSLVMIAF